MRIGRRCAVRASAVGCIGQLRAPSLCGDAQRLRWRSVAVRVGFAPCREHHGSYSVVHVGHCLSADRTREGDARVLQLLARFQAAVLPHVLRQRRGHVEFVRVRIPAIDNALNGINVAWWERFGPEVRL